MTNGEKVDVILLAGGLGTRLQSIVPDTQKTVAPVDGRPFLDLLLEYLDGFECISKVVIAVGYRADDVIAQYERDSSHRFPIVFSREERLLGTGGGTKRALLFSNRDNVVMLNGDTYSGVDIEKLLDFHRTKGADMTMAVAPQANSDRYGTIEFGNDGRVEQFQEKARGGSGYVNVGTTIFKRSIFDAVTEDVVLSIEKDLMPQFVREKKVYAFVHEAGFLDIGTPESYERAHEYMRARKAQ